MKKDKQQLEALWKKTVAKAWADPNWKERLLADPVAVLKEEGLDVPEKAKIRVVEELPGTRTFVLPLMPEGAWDPEQCEKRLAAICWSGSCDYGN